ncbi:MAG: hypothetical protein DRO40_04525 [Thermoprotei archaeon]|nr:MAG: hypothetical protein DRO40_04525 [Thermoprotei archaeon]
MDVKIIVDDDMKELPIRVIVMYFTVNKVTNSQVHPLVYEEALKVIDKYKRTYNLSTLKDLPNIKLFREFLWRIKIDPTKMRPSHEALLRRVLRTGEFPKINTIVDIGNLVSLKYLVPIGIYDLDKVKPPLVFRYSIDGEAFYPIGSDAAKILRAGIPVLADSEKVLHIFPHRDSKFSAVSIKTNRILAIVGGVEGIPLSTLKSSVNNLVDYLTRYCDAEDISDVKVVVFGGRE